MAYPAGITLRTVNVGGATALESGEPLTITVRFAASRPLIWGATGWRFPSVVYEVAGTVGNEITVDLPITNQAGWRTNSNQVIDVAAAGSYTHTYTATVTTTANGRPVSQDVIGPFALPADDLSPVDLDLTLPTTTVAGGVVMVPDTWDQRVQAAEAAAAGAAAALDTRVAADLDLGATEGTVGLGTLWADAQVSPSPRDRFVVIDNASGEGSWIQEPQLWVHDGTLHMLYSASGGIRHASCSVDDDPLDASSWTKTGVVIGSGAGGESGGAAHPGVYIEGDTLYCYYMPSGTQYIDVATANLATPTVFTHAGNVLTPPAGTSAPLANPFLLKLGVDSYALYFEANTTLPLWQTGRAVGTSPLGPFTDAMIPLPGLSPNPGKATTSNLHVIPEDGGYVGFFHSAWGERQQSIARPTAGYMATSGDGITWKVAGNGYPLIRLAHAAEVDQVADLFPVEVGGERYLFWSGNYASRSMGQIMGTRLKRPVSAAHASGQHQIAGGSGAVGSVIPRSWSKHLRLSPEFTTTTVGSFVAVPGLTLDSLTFPEATRLRFGYSGNFKASAGGELSVQLYLPSITGVLTETVSQVVSVATAYPSANSVLPYSGTGVVDVGPNTPITIRVQAKAGGAGATLTGLAGAVLWVTAEKLT